MSKRYFQNRTQVISLAVQAACVKSRYPGFDTCLLSHTLKITGQLHPRPRSEAYTVEIRYNIKGKPEVKVIQPELIKNFRGERIPHLYPGKLLCLYQPLYGEFKPYHLLIETIIPWSSLWLFHYENWHMTGKWEGGGEHPYTPLVKPDRKNFLM